MTKAEVDHALRAPERNWNVDGLPELLMGGAWALWGGVILAQQLWPSRTTTILAAFLPMAVAVVFMFFGSRIVLALKERITYPRVGYVKPLPPGKMSKASSLLIGLVVAAFITWLILRGPVERFVDLLPAIMGGVCALGIAAIGWRTQTPRFRHYAVPALALGAMAQELWPGERGVGVVMVGIGLAAVAGGGFTLFKLLQMPKEEGV